MNDNTEKIQMIKELLVIDRKLTFEQLQEQIQNIIDLPELTSLNVTSAGWGTIKVNGKISAVLPLDTLRSLNSGFAISATTEASKVARAKLQGS